MEKQAQQRVDVLLTRLVAKASAAHGKGLQGPQPKPAPHVWGGGRSSGFHGVQLSTVLKAQP